MKNFTELNLIAPLQRALREENYRTPTPIQSQTIPSTLEGRDILGCAQTGTGKTASFALPILDWLGQLERKQPFSNRPAALVLAPTRELAIQIGESFKTYGRHLDVKTVLIYGGVNQKPQVRSLNQGAHIVVATPGRLLDLMNQGFIQLNFLKKFVLDEADQMMNMGFLPDLRRIIAKLPDNRQSLFFSATLPPKIIDLARQLLTDPVHVDVTPKVTSVEKIEQGLLQVQRGEKQTILKGILRGHDVDRALVFTRTKRGANRLSMQLNKNGITAAAIHGNKSQNARVRALDAFRRNEIKVLVATDVAARGIDIEGISHVINYDVPVEPESYVHRICLTGRAGASGIALTLCTPDERSELHAIEKLIGDKIPLAYVEQEPRRQSHRGGGGDTGPAKGRGRRGKRLSKETKERIAEEKRSRSRSDASGNRERSDSDSSEGRTSERSGGRSRFGKSRNSRSRGGNRSGARGASRGGASTGGEGRSGGRSGDSGNSQSQSSSNRSSSNRTSRRPSGRQNSEGRDQGGAARSAGRRSSNSGNSNSAGPSRSRRRRK